jgi:hypothetical protein
VNIGTFLTSHCYITHLNIIYAHTHTQTQINIVDITLLQKKKEAHKQIDLPMHCKVGVGYPVSFGINSKE